MNKERRKTLLVIRDALDLARSGLEDNQAGELRTEQEAEQEAFDNLSEGLQQAERGQAIEAAANALDSACDSVVEAIDALQAAVDSINEAIGDG